MSIIFAMSAKFSLRDNSIAKHVPTTMVVTFKNIYLYIFFKKTSSRTLLIIVNSTKQVDSNSKEWLMCNEWTNWVNLQQKMQKYFSNFCPSCLKKFHLIFHLFWFKTSHCAILAPWPWRFLEIFLYLCRISTNLFWNYKSTLKKNAVAKGSGTPLFPSSTSTRCFDFDVHLFT